jgi:aminoglycoside phosphotransferase (APT) family kinase protein
VRRWQRQYEHSAIGLGVTPHMHELAAWLLTHLPPAPSRPTVVHGDYRLDNLVWDLNEPKVTTG